MLPKLDGIEVCRRLREVAPIAVVMLTARGEEEDRIAGLRIGADDYVTKPFSPAELVERVRAVLRRTLRDAAPRTEPLTAGRLHVDRAAHEARLGGEVLSLTTKEYDLLVHLMANPRRSFRRDELLESVWGWSFGDTSTVTVHMRRLREKIEVDPERARVISRQCAAWATGSIRESRRPDLPVGHGGGRFGSGCARRGCAHSQRAPPAGANPGDRDCRGGGDLDPRWGSVCRERDVHLAPRSLSAPRRCRSQRGGRARRGGATGLATRSQRGVGAGPGSARWGGEHGGDRRDSGRRHPSSNSSPKK